MNNNHEKFYSFAQAYDVAFDFKDISSECDFLTSVFRNHTGRMPASFIDIAAGPALHAIQMAKQGMRSAAIDLSKEMVDYGLAKAAKEKTNIEYFQGDMSAFTVTHKYDLAGIFMDSTSYLLTNESTISHFRSVANALNSGGIYVLEMAHPRDIFSSGTSTVNSWEMERSGLWTSVQWGSPDDLFDPLTQVTQITVTLKIRKDGKEEQLTEKASQRCFTCNEFNALVQAEGSFDIVENFGAMKSDVPFSNDKAAWRFISVLRKK